MTPEIINTFIGTTNLEGWGNVDRIEVNGNEHRIEYWLDEDGDEYAFIYIPQKVIGYVEIEDGTYGVMQGFRLYRDEVFQ